MQYTICSFNYSWQYSNLRLELIWEINLEMAKKKCNYFGKLFFQTQTYTLNQRDNISFILVHSF